MIVLGIDPGPERSGYVVFDYHANSLEEYGHEKNTEIQTYLPLWIEKCDLLAIEMVEPRGMAVGWDTFRTLVWIGRFDAGLLFHLIRPLVIRTTLCGVAKANERNVKQALIDAWGGDRKAIGGIKCPDCKGKGWKGRGRPPCPTCLGARWERPPGPLHELTSIGNSRHLWAALAVAEVARRQWHETGL